MTTCIHISHQITNIDKPFTKRQYSRFVQIEIICRQQIKCPSRIETCFWNTKKKTLWEKEKKMFFQQWFLKPLSKGHEMSGFCGKELTMKTLMHLDWFQDQTEKSDH